MEINARRLLVQFCRVLQLQVIRTNGMNLKLQALNIHDS